jgi:hypothetical protein
VPFQRPDRTQIPHLAAQSGLGGAAYPFAQIRQAQRPFVVGTQDRRAERTSEKG